MPRRQLSHNILLTRLSFSHPRMLPKFLQCKSLPRVKRQHLVHQIYEVRCEGMALRLDPPEPLLTATEEVV
jgi:hypothetical protein